MTLFQLEASAQAPCSSTITGLAGCPPPAAAAPAGAARPGTIASRAAATTTAKSARRLMRRAVRLSDMSASSPEAELRNCSWLGVLLAGGTTVTARRRGSPPWKSLVGPVGTLAQQPPPCPAVVPSRPAGFRVARAVGVESEMELAFAGLHQLCTPMLGNLAGLPGPQRDALGTVFGLSTGQAPDRLLVGLAALRLLSAVAEGLPLVSLVDDAQWRSRIAVHLA